ncbi:MAG TPA: thiamine phosphate synthase [Kofleriaceae bacterium]
MSWLGRVRFVAITDRTKMVDAAVLATRDGPQIAAAFGEAIARVVARFGDAVLVQVREKDLDGGALLQLVRAALATGARVLVNDRVDVALAAGAHGVHLPERGLSIADAGAVAREAFVIGVSCHSIDGVERATSAGADLVQLGPIWETPGKPNPLGLDALAAARRVTTAHLVAIGGIDDKRVDLCRQHGADAVAAIRAVWSGELEPR